ncbi:MAG TPA: SH3 domain-containing protein [Aggregatilinea sp.]|uniref:SH3 domain-containing protein n=1 Tax=Aggregatilinea sp. TaxID=2806333 RepID=UPI002CA2A9EF|nr:SH3 domain-containing protein [Aggregatilinea sp.]HML22224.1 SH3 domain-containing protein [Aggregatilinea sp.]
MKRALLVVSVLVLIASAGAAGLTTAAAQSGTGICNFTVTASPSLNFRSGPGTNFPVVTRAQPGSVWRVYEVRYDDISALRVDEWIRLQAPDGATVWAAAYYNNVALGRYDITQDCLDVRFPTTATPGTPPSSPATCTVTLSVDVMVRSAPGTGSPRVGGLRAGQEITVQSVQVSGSYVWAQHSGGWSAIYNRAASAWWARATSTEGQKCLNVPGWSGTGLFTPPVSALASLFLDAPLFVLAGVAPLG